MDEFSQIVLKMQEALDNIESVKDALKDPKLNFMLINELKSELIDSQKEYEMYKNQLKALQQSEDIENRGRR